jgi:YVTN family beta-propeller protein
LLAVSATSASFLAAASGPSGATKNRSLGINPAASNELWVVNKENEKVVVMDRFSGSVLASVSVGVAPRNVAFNSTGSKAYITNQRGNVALDKTLLEYTGSEILGSVSVVDTASRNVIKTITAGIGAEPFGIALAPNGKYLLVTNFRSSSLSVIDPASDTVVASFQYNTDFNFPPTGVTIADLDSNGDMIADFEGPRAIAITGSSDRAYITHLKSGFVSVMSLALNGSGVPTSISLAKRINLNKYPFDAFNNPVKITEAKSQGVTRFLDDISISPDGTKAWLTHELLNVNHDVNVPFNPGAFANRVYGAISIIDLANETFEYGDAVQNDASDRIHFSWNVPAVPTIAIPYGLSNGDHSRRLPTVRATSDPALGTTVGIRIEHGAPSGTYQLYVGRVETKSPIGANGTLYIVPTGIYAAGTLDSNGAATANLSIPNSTSLTGTSLYYQAVVKGPGGSPVNFTNGLRLIFGPASGAVPDATMMRVAIPSKTEFSPDGRRALVLSRSSEDVTVFDITGAHPHYMGITPRRDSTPTETQVDKNHTPFSASRTIGDRPTGMVVGEFDTKNDSANVYVNNDASRDLSVLTANFTTGVVGNPSGLLKKYIAPANDLFTADERTGSELISDGSRTQTTGMFAASCESCHFEGGDDGNVWQRGVGPRSTIAMYGGIRRSGFLLWKANRLNLGETGPMFAGENGGTGVFTDQEQDGLVAYAEKIAVPLNPHLEAGGQLSLDAQQGRDLFLGLNDTGINPTFRSSNCQSCHTVQDPNGLTTWFTNDQIKIFDPTYDEAHQDPCFALKENIMGNIIQDVNSGVNLVDGQGQLIIDRNGDGISDVESYNPMNPELDADFTRDDPNSVQCDDPNNPGNPLVFSRPAGRFDVPTKMGVFFTGPYFHDHAVLSLRSTVDPISQTAPLPTLNKLRNTFHDIRGTVVQQFLGSSNVDDDIRLILKFIESL